jgi:PBP/GOBP family
MKVVLSFLLVLSFFAFLEAQSNEFKARRAARQCVFEHKVDYSVAMKYSKGDMSDDSDSSKCFLKCFAYKLGLFSKVTGRPQKEVLLEYTNFLSEPNLPVSRAVQLIKSFIFYYY